jgi:hypothetical protein
MLRPKGRPTITLNRRVARAFVLGVFLLVLAGPWADALPTLPLPLAYVLVSAGAAAPLACLVAILLPSSWLAGFLHRVSGGAAVALVIAALAWMLRSPSDGTGLGGLTLCLGALLLGAAVEIFPGPGERRRDYADVFR